MCIGLCYGFLNNKFLKIIVVLEIIDAVIIRAGFRLLAQIRGNHKLFIFDFEVYFYILFWIWVCLIFLEFITLLSHKVI